MTEKELAKIFWNNVKKALKDQNKTRHNFCLRIGVKEKTLSSMMCRNQCPNIFLLTRIRDALSIECDQLLYSFDSASRRVPLSENEKRLIELIRSNSENRQNIIIDAVSAILEYIKNPDEELHIENVPEQQFQHVETPLIEEASADVSATEQEMLTSEPDDEAVEAVEQHQPPASEPAQHSQTEITAASATTRTATETTQLTRQKERIVQPLLFGLDDSL